MLTTLVNLTTTNWQDKKLAAPHKFIDFFFRHPTVSLTDIDWKDHATF